MNYFKRLTYLLVFSLLISFLVSCSSDDSSSEDSVNQDMGTDEDNQDTDDNSSDDNDNSGDTDTDNSSSNLTERFVFNENLVIEHSWNNGGCDNPPCDTVSEDLDIVFNTLPDDPYFYMDADEVELNLECQH